MIQYTHYQPSDGLEVVELWNSAFGEAFPMDLRLWRQNVDDAGNTLFEASIVARDTDADNRVVGHLIAKSPKHVNSIAVRPEYRRRGIASQMFALARKSVPSAPDSKWLVGQDRGHFFPGVPEECEAALQFFEHAAGLTRGTGVTVDLSRDLTDFEIEPRIQERIEALKRDGIVFAPCEVEDQSALVDYLGANFSGRWLADTIHRLNIEPNPREIIIAKRPAVGAVIGFAHTYSTMSRYVGAPIYWRPLLGPKYGGLGPIGVDKEMRKIGLGISLLAFAIQSVKDRGATRMVIDWTDLVDFYAKVGFTPWKRYISMREA